MKLNVDEKQFFLIRSFFFDQNFKKSATSMVKGSTRALVKWIKGARGFII